MGWTPQETEAASLWQLAAAQAGWAEATGRKAEEDLTEDDWQAAEAAFDAAPERTT